MMDEDGTDDFFVVDEDDMMIEADARFELYGLMGESFEKVEGMIRDVDAFPTASTANIIVKSGFDRQSPIEEFLRKVNESGTFPNVFSSDQCDSSWEACGHFNGLVARDAMDESYSRFPIRIIEGDSACTLGVTYGHEIDFSRVFDVDRYLESLRSVSTDQKCTLVSFDGKSRTEVTVTDVSRDHFVIDGSVRIFKSIESLSVFPFWVWVEGENDTMWCKRDVNEGRVSVFSRDVDPMQLIEFVTNLNNMLETYAAYPEKLKDAITYEKRKLVWQTLSKKCNDKTICSPQDDEYQEEQEEPTKKKVLFLPSPGAHMMLDMESYEEELEEEEDEEVEFETPNFRSNLQGPIRLIDGFEHYIQVRNDLWIDRSWAAFASTGTFKCESFDRDTLPVSRSKSVVFIPKDSSIEFSFVRPILLDVDPSKRLVELNDIIDIENYSEMFFQIVGPEETTKEKDEEEGQKDDVLNLSGILSRIQSAHLSESESRLFFDGMEDLTRRILSLISIVSRKLIQQGWIDDSGKEVVFNPVSILASISRYAKSMTSKYIESIEDLRNTIMKTAVDNDIKDIMNETDILEVIPTNSRSKRVIEYFRNRILQSSEEWKNLVFVISMSVLGAIASILMGGEDVKSLELFEKHAKGKVTSRQIEMARQQIETDRSNIVRWRLSKRPRSPIVETNVIESISTYTDRIERESRPKKSKVRTSSLPLSFQSNTRTTKQEYEYDEIVHDVSTVQIIDYFPTEKDEKSVHVSSFDVNEKYFGVLGSLIEQSTARFGVPTKELLSKYMKYITSGITDSWILRRSMRKVLSVDIPKFLMDNKEDENVSKSCVYCARLSDSESSDSDANVLMFSGLSHVICGEDPSKALDERTRDLIVYFVTRLVDLIDTDKLMNFDNLKNNVNQEVGRFRSNRMQSLLELDNESALLYQQLTSLGGFTSSKAIEHIRAKSDAFSHSPGDSSKSLAADDFSKLDASFFGA